MTHGILVQAVVLVALSAAACAGEAPREAGARSAVEAEPPVPEPVPATPSGPPARLAVRVLETHPHDPQAFTQGLLFHDGALYESTGRYGRSSLRRVDPETGEVLAERSLPAHLFGEGLALAGDRLVQLTWQEGVALAWDPATLERVGETSYRGEGWGLTFDGERLVMSDGTSWLVFRDPGSFAEIGRVQVTLEGRPLPNLNELEWVDGSVWANVWGSQSVVRIDPASGVVTAVADLSELAARLPSEEARGIGVLNGIAWWPEREAFLVTGKLWPRTFLVRFE